MQSLTGKTIIITGASTGAGEATARLCVQEGANVVLAARTEEALQATVRALGKQARGVVADVANGEACLKLIEAASKAFGRIDGLVNNAGFQSRGEVESVPIDKLLQIIEVNLMAPMRLSKLVLPHLRANASGGSIVNIASLAGRVPVDHEAAYSASKAGLRAFSFAMREELKETGISVSVVSPGPIETGFILNDLDNVPNMVFSQPMSTADEVARVVVASLKDGKRERVMHLSSGILTNLAYLAPSLKSAITPLLEAKGRKAKARYLGARSKGA